MQEFLTDKQTLDDLNIFESLASDRSIYSYYDLTTTIEGKNKLTQMFKHPLTDRIEIENRSDSIRHFLEVGIDLIFNRETIDFVEYYLKQSNRPKSFSFLNAIHNTWNHFFSPSPEYYQKRRGVTEILDLIVFLKDSLSRIAKENLRGVLEEISLLIEKLQADSSVQRCLKRRPDSISLFDIEQCDFAFRNIYDKTVRRMLDCIYEIDVYNSVVRATYRYKLCFPVFEVSEKLRINLEDVFHLFLPEPTSNNFYIDEKRNVCVITGVNMSGKSTVIKSVAISIYLAHLGFPVPARNMKTSLLNGLLTTINLSDDLAGGSSHFYNEVKRVKYISEIICQNSNVLVIFDELFRGTNVKDAFDSSLSIIEKFSEISDSLFIISTHIVEIADDLERKNGKIAFYKLQTLMENGSPRYNYKLQSGITRDRMGFWILKNEGIIELLARKVKSLKLKVAD